MTHQPIITRSGRSYTGFSCRAELARMYWAAFNFDSISTITWFYEDRTFDGLDAILQEAALDEGIIQQARARHAAIRSTINNAVSGEKGENQ